MSASSGGVAEATGWLDSADLASARARSDFLELHRELVTPEVVSNLTALVPQLAKSNPGRALEVAELAAAIAARLENAESTAQSLRAKANALYATGQNHAAVAHHRKAIRLFRSLGNMEQVARTLSSSIQPLILQGRYAVALNAVREARLIFAEQGNDWRLARLELNAGNILDRQDCFREALACYQRAYDYLSQHQQDDPEAVAVALHNMAVCYVSLHDFRSAETTYEKARSFAATHGMPVLVGQADYNIAWLHYLTGDYGRALAMLRSARESCRASGDDYHFALCHLDLSEIYLELNLNLEAGEAAEQAATDFTQLNMQYERGKSLTNVAIAMSRRDTAGPGLDLFSRAREIFVKEKNRVLPSVVDLYRAIVLFSQGRDSESRRLSTAALLKFQKFHLTSKSIACRLLLARLDLRAQDLSSAQKHCAQARRLLRTVKSPLLSCQTYALSGQIEMAAGRLQQADTAFKLARDYLERLRSHIQSDELKISFMQDRVDIYECLVKLRLRDVKRRRTSEAMFTYVQQAKSRTLLDLLSTSRLDASNGQRDATAADARFRELREELNWFFHAAQNAQLQQGSRQHILQLRAESQKRERELLKLSREQVQSGGREAHAQSTPAISVGQVQQALEAGTTVLEYFQAQDQIVVLVLTRDRLAIAPLAEASRVAASLDLLALQLSKFRLDKRYVEAFEAALLTATKKHLRDLHDLLVKPVRELLTGRHIVIAPHGALHALPFHALFDGEQYLVDEFEVSYAPSASVYALCKTRRARARGGSLVLGIPDATVPFVEQEVEAVAACLPRAEVHLGRDASAELLREKGRCAQVIHIATHGYFRRDNPLFSGIRLGDSYLSLYDLNQFTLAAELITLSGCATGVHVVAAGDELLGLARGLIQAGAATSMLTLWDVQDRSSAQLMTLFYRDFARDRKKKACALRNAMLQLKAERPHPYYWAPYVLIGNA